MLTVTFFFGSHLPSMPICLCDPVGAPRPASFGFRAWRLRFSSGTPPPQLLPDDDSEESEGRQELTRTSAEGDWAMATRKELAWLDTVDLRIV